MADVQQWRLRSVTLSLAVPLVMGIVNATPDSFSDGGRFFCLQDGLAQSMRLLDDGADILDVGGESTRPGSPAATAEAVSAEEEQRRVVPLIHAVLRARSAAIVSVDTYRASTARAAVEAGAQIVNDVSGMLWDTRMAATCADLACGVVVMHTRGLPSEWAAQPALPSGQVGPNVLTDLRDRVAAVMKAGVLRERIAVDPGFGFGKRGEENFELLQGLPGFQELALPVLVGVSRKGFLGGTSLEERDAATHAFGQQAVRKGANVLRVHDVRGARAMLRQRGMVQA